MDKAIQDEALERIAFDVKAGFWKESEIFQGILDMFYDVPDFDEVWLRASIAEPFRQHQVLSRSWDHPTDFEKLAAAFDALILEKIVCLHNAGMTKSDGELDCEEVVDQLVKLGIQAVGYCYYHGQDLDCAVDPEVRKLFLGFDGRMKKLRRWPGGSLKRSIRKD